MPISLILTVLNEAKSLPTLLDSIAAQTVLPDEVVICDGGSRDGTLDLLRAETRFPLRVIESPGANISRGRNLAIAAAIYEIIAVTDAGVRLDTRWLERLCVALGVEPGVGSDTSHAPPSTLHETAAGFFLPDPHNTFEIAMSATVLPALREIKPQTFLPSSRSIAFRKSAWQMVGGYPEWLDYCEDLIFDLNLRARCGPFAFAPEAIAYFRPRGSLRSFYKQYFLYARGDGKAKLFFKRHIIRYITYLVVLPVLLGLMAFGTVWLGTLAGIALGLGAALYLKAPYQRLGPLAAAAYLSWLARLKAIALIPVIRVTGDIAKMIGYPVGVRWRRTSALGLLPSGF
jgi:glycosyltransferase involved in cell wall biosynthesis